jgi:hypothetical protein
MLQVAYNDKTRPHDARARDLNNSYLCYFLALLVMIGTGWVIVDGIIAMEPDSKAHNSKIYQNLILLILEGFVFSLAGQYKRYAFWLRAFGWGVFALQIVLMMLANYSIGATAGKAAALKTATVAEILKQADADRKAAETLQNSADKLNKSKNGWLNSQGGNKATEAAQKTASAAGAADKISKIEVSAPIIDKIGENGLMALSGALAVITEFAAMLLMHYGGVLRNDALVDAVPVEYQILAALGTLQNALGVAPTLEALPAPSPAPAPGQPATPAPASFKQPGQVAPKDFSGLSYSTKATLAGAGAVAAMTAPTMTQAAPAVPAAAPVSPSDKGINDDTTPLSTLTPPSLDRGINVDTPTPVNDDTPDAPTKARKARVARDGLPMDSGVGEHDGYRFRRAVTGVQDRTIRPSLSGLYAGVGATADVARRFLAEMAKAGEIVRNAEDTAWIPAPKKAKKGGVK